MRKVFISFNKQLHDAFYVPRLTLSTPGAIIILIFTDEAKA